MIKTIDLSLLPPPELISDIERSIDPQEIKKEILARLKKELGDDFDLSEASPFHKLAEIFAFRESMLISRINHAARQSMIAYAEGANLINLGALFGVEAQPNETDDELRGRIVLAPNMISTAGAEDSIRAIAFQVGAEYLKEVRAFSEFEEFPGVTFISLLFKDEFDPDINKSKDEKTILEERKKGFEVIKSHLNSKPVRPIATKFEILEAKKHKLKFVAVIYALEGVEDTLIINESRKRLNDFIDRSQKIGGFISLSTLIGVTYCNSILKIDAKIFDNEKEITEILLSKREFFELELSLKIKQSL